MGLIRCVLKHKQAELNLNDVSGRFHIARDFVPPPVSLRPNLAGGTSANRMDGATLIGTKAENRRWAFGVHVTGDSEAEVRGGISLLDSFLRRGTPSDPVYVHVRGSEDVSFEPLWGQYGSDLRYEIVFGVASASRQYSFGFIREGELPECQVNLQIKPFAVGLQQRLASAQGGVFEDVVGSSDGLSRGTVIHEATTNKMTNPIFGHGTWNNGWTAGGNIVSAENADRDFITHGKSSARISAIDTTGNTFTQSIDVGNTNAHMLSGYVKLQGGGTPSSTNLQLYYGSAQTTTFREIGNGFWLMTASVTGVASATTTGVVVKSGHTVYVDGFQIEEKVYQTSLAHGDMLGCSWAGTDHASTSTRAQVFMSVPDEDIFQITEGTIRVIALMPYANTAGLGFVYFFTVAATGSPSGYWNSGTGLAYFTDGTNTIQSASQTWSAGDILILHFVYSSSGMKIYRDGSEIATGGDWVVPSDATDLYIGSTTSGGSGDQINATVMGFETFAEAMSATEISDDYDNLLEHVEDNRRLSPIPYLWTKDGDDVVDNFNDGTKDNWALIGGVPGTVSADLEIDGTLSSGWDVVDTVWISRILMGEFVDPIILFKDISSGSTVTTSWISLGGFETLDELTSPILYGAQLYVFSRLTDAGSGLIIKSRLADGAYHIESDELAISADGSNRLFKTLANVFPEQLKFSEIAFTPTRTLMAKRSSGSALVTPDYLLMMPEPITKIGPPSAIKANVLDFVYKGLEAFAYTSDQIAANLPVTGSVLNVEPGKLNVLMSILGELEDDPTTTYTITYTKTYIEPRWALL